MADAFLPNFNQPELQTQAPAIADVKPNEPAPLAKPLVNQKGQQVSHETLVELKAYIEQCVVQTVSQAVTTVIPDVVETTLSHISQPSTVPQQTSPVSQAAIASQASAGIAQPIDEDFVPGTYQGRRPTEVKSDLIAWVATGGIVAIMAGLAAYTINAAPNAQTTQVMGQQGHQIEQQNGLIKDLAKEAAQAKCRAFCF